MADWNERAIWGIDTDEKENGFWAATLNHPALTEGTSSSEPQLPFI